ncbi:hypothetical protein V1280_007855 [Bradyrhizobium sp. AZCC 2230]
MRQQPCRAGGAQDCDELVDGIEEARFVAADMCGEQLAVSPHRLRQRAQLVGVGKGARRIDEAERQAGSALGKLLREQRLHRRDLFATRRAAVVTEHGEPDRGMSDQRDQVERHARPFQGEPVAVETVEDFVGSGFAGETRKVQAQHLGGACGRRIEREAAIADHERGHALQYLFGPVRFAQADQIVMAMGVDEARREIASARVDDVGLLRRQRDTDRCDAAAADAQVGLEPRRAGAVDQPGIADERVLAVGTLGHAPLLSEQARRLVGTPLRNRKSIRSVPAPRHRRRCRSAARFRRS